VFVKFCEWIYK